MAKSRVTPTRQKRAFTVLYHYLRYRRMNPQKQGQQVQVVGEGRRTVVGRGTERLID